MRSLIIASVLVAAMAMGLQTATKNTYVSKKGVPTADTTYPKAWISLFDPPYENCPEIMMDIGCTTDDVCYVPGGSNGVGFGVYKFDGQLNGNFQPLHSIDNVEFNFDLFMGVAGTATNPKGAVGGVSLDNGLKYFVNDSWLAPANLPVSEEQSISTDSTGEHIIMVDGFSTTWPQIILESTNAGKNYTGIAMNADPYNKTCTLPMFQDMGDDKTWYFAGGSFPGQNENCNSGGNGGGNGAFTSKQVLKKISNGYAWIRPGATVEQVEALGWKVSKRNPRLAKRSLSDVLKAGGSTADKKKCKQDGPNCPYTAAVFKTDDKGTTFSTHNFNTSIWSPDAIACANKTTCILVGSGNGMFPGSRILRTTDSGATWNEVLFLPSEAGEEIWEISAVEYNPTNKNEVWIAGGVENPAGHFAVFFYSNDGGSNWHRSTEVTFVETVMALSFTKDGNGFAVGITQFDDSTIMRYTANGFPQTPAPVYTGNFSQVQCDDAACSVNCTTLSLPQDTCLKLNNGGSAIAHCDIANRVLIQDQFPIDSTCSGPNEAMPQALNVCFNLTSQGGGSFKNVCGPTTGKPAPLGASLKTAKRKM